MGSKLATIDKRVSASPDQYNIPSKVVETQGKTMSKLLGSSLVNNKMNVPGPGTYSQEKNKHGNY